MQAMKNPTSRLAATVRKLDTRQRVCLTGTPVENHLGELWSLMAFANPGLLGTHQELTHALVTALGIEVDLAHRLRRCLQANGDGVEAEQDLIAHDLDGTAK